jgi:benzoyl-CoA reductase subunit BamC
MCESDSSIKEPMCVQWCLTDALTYEEREEEGPEAEGVEDVDAALETLADRHGWDRVVEAVGRMAKKA